MREQVIQKVGNRSGLGSKARTGGGKQLQNKRSRQSFADTLRVIGEYLPIVLKVALALGIITVVLLGYRAAASASFFQVRRIQTRGASRASTQAIENTVRRDLATTGVWRADLGQLSSHLEQLPWIHTAVVTRVLPDGIRVRIIEREPKAVVRTGEGKFFWVDEDAVSLGEMNNADQMPPFFLRGWNEDATSAAREENKARVRKFLDLQREWETQGVAERVSEVNLQDLGDIRAQLTGNDAAIEIRLGAEDQDKRLKPALATLDKLRQTSRGPFISYLIVGQSKRVIVGTLSGVQAMADISDASDNSVSVEPAKETVSRKKEEVKADPVKKDRTVKARNQEKKSDQKRG